MTDETEVRNHAQHLDSLRDLRDNARAIKAMPAFQRWAEDVLSQVKGRYGELRQPVKGTDGALEQEFLKGEMNGLEHAVMYWDLMIEFIDREIKEAEADHAEDSAE